MSELPREAKALLALAKDVHDPPDGARERVRRAVAIGIGASAGVTLTGKAVASVALGPAAAPPAAKVGLLASLGGKLAATTGALVLVGTTAVIAPRFTQEHHLPAAKHASQMHASPHPNIKPPLSQASPRPALEPHEPSDVEANADVRGPSEEPTVPTLASPSDAAERLRQGARRPRTSGDTLAAELQVLRTAADAIARDEPDRALDVLDQHSARFATPALREEREGLRALARCGLHAAGSGSSGAAFLAHNPDTLLGRRIKKACGLEGGP